MKNIAWKVGLILFVIALCLFAVIPPKSKIRLGKDLQGGTSLIYLVKIPDSVEDRQGVLSQTISVLKERVDPRGQLTGAERRVPAVVQVPHVAHEDRVRGADVLPGHGPSEGSNRPLARPAL